MFSKVDYNIEYCHIYVNENFTTEHYRAVNLLKTAINDLEKKNLSYTTSVLIDDYNPTEKVLNVKSFIKELDCMGGKADHVVYESKLTRLKDDMLGVMRGKLKRRYQLYINKTGKCPCSFLVAAWYLLRLGIFTDGQIIKPKKTKPFAAKQIITILPQRYGSVEKRALEILESTVYADDVRDNIEHIFF